MISIEMIIMVRMLMRLMTVVIKLPALMLSSLKLGSTGGRTGAEVVGADMIYNYEQVLRQVVYSNQMPAYYLNRQFKLVCSELSDRFTSNEHVQTLTVAHPPVNAETVSAPRPAHHQVSHHGAEVGGGGPRLLAQGREYFTQGQGQGHAVVVVVVCVGLLLTVLTV